MKCCELTALLARDGWRLTRIRGAQHHFSHPVKNGVVMIPAAETDILSPGSLRSVLRLVDLSLVEGRKTARFLVVIEPTAGGFSSYAPDLPGCISTGNSAEAVEASMREAIAGYLEELQAAGSPPPSSRATIRYIGVAG